jgi:hypothetical protein
MVTTRGGKMSFLGRGGSGTGRPADGFLIDDPSRTRRKRSRRRSATTCGSGSTASPTAAATALTWQVIIATRWSDDDLIARLTDPQNPYYNEEVASKWTVINIPAEIDDAELARALGVEVGSALWPERFPLELLRTSKLMDPIGYSALYMGRPTPPEGAFYKQNDFARRSITAARVSEAARACTRRATWLFDPSATRTSRASARGGSTSTTRSGCTGICIGTAARPTNRWRS